MGAALGGDAPTFGSPQFVAFSGGGGQNVFGQPARPAPPPTGYSYFQNCPPQHQQNSGSSSLNFVTSAATTNSGGLGQWNLGWPQWPTHDLQQQQQQKQQHNCTNQNRWSLPISASTSSRSSSALSSATPSVDRYAALKDLDDQFREIKFESETNNNNNNHIISSSSASAAAAVNGLSNGLMNGNHHHNNDVHQANPFKTANPFQQQAQQQQQQQTLSWAIPGSTPPATNGFYATSSTSPYQNGFVHPAGANMLNGNGVNGFTNAFHHQHQQQLHHHPSSNGGIQVTGAVPPYGHFGHFGNPFMAAGATTATSNSNNPFL